jgi:hypothetical protein
VASVVSFWLVDELKDRPAHSEFQYVRVVYSPIEDLTP